MIPKLNLDLSSLENDFHLLSRRLHPDRFARAPENEKQWSLGNTALLNDAYRTLKDPITRTEYVLKLHGAQIGEGYGNKERSAGEMRSSRVPDDLLEEVFELNMQLEEMRMAHKAAAENDLGLKQSLTQAQSKFEALRDAVDRDLQTQWDAWDNGGESGRRAAQQAMVSLLDRRRYFSNLVRDVTDALAGRVLREVFAQRGR